MTDRHVAAVCEDDLETQRIICDHVAALDHEPVRLGTLDEIEGYLASGSRPCYWLQDTPMPPRRQANAHEKVDESGIRLVRGLSEGRFRIPIIVLTGFSSAPKLVMSVVLNARDEEASGFLSGRKDRMGHYRETYLTRTDAEIVAGLVQARKPTKANAMACLRRAGFGTDLVTAVRMVQKARKAVDVHAVVNGRESQKRWRSIHTVEEKTATAFWFHPSGGMRWGIVVGVQG